MTIQTTELTFHAIEQVLAEELEGFVPRVEQRKLAEAIMAAQAEGKHFAGEGGTGVGKSFAYLGAMILTVVAEGGRVVVSATTKALQNQLATKDVPLVLRIAERLGIKATAAVLKGRSNYLCRAQAADNASISVLPALLDEIDAGADGDWDNFSVDVLGEDRARLSISSDACPGRKECPFATTCTVEAAKDRAARANIVIVNHSLLILDAKLRAETDGYVSLLGKYDHLVVDEAHELEEVASNTLGATLRETSFTALVALARNWSSNTDPDRSAAILKATEQVGLTAHWAYDGLSELLQAAKDAGSKDDKVVLTDAHLGHLGEAMDEVDAALVSLRQALRNAEPDGGDRKVYSRWQRILRRAVNLSARWSNLLLAPQNELVRWVETEEGKKGPVLVLRSSPIHVGATLQEILWTVPATLVSATMTVNHSFEFITGRLGLEDYDELEVGTPFDYAHQALLYIPSLPNPSGPTRNAWSEASIAEIGRLVEASRGRALVLFTSTWEMNVAARTLGSGRRGAQRIHGHTLLVQGDGQSNKALASQFLTDTHSVLFALKSFFTGIDIPGEALSLLVLNKLPFPVPSEPVFAARSDAIERAGGNSFSALSIPITTITLKQAVGRLIRRLDDRGVIAVLDPRLNRGWGLKVRNSLPPARQVDGIHDVEAFLA